MNDIRVGARASQMKVRGWSLAALGAVTIVPVAVACGGSNAAQPTTAANGMATGAVGTMPPGYPQQGAPPPGYPAQPGYPQQPAGYPAQQAPQQPGYPPPQQQPPP
jgi:hypothetical protein